MLLAAVIAVTIVAVASENMVLLQIGRANVAMANGTSARGGAGSSCLQSSLRYGADQLTSYSSICCTQPQAFAEPSGSASAVGLYDELSESGTTTFYDAQCGVPLYTAPVGRSFEDFKSESIAHGWPSFRSAEVLSDVTVLPGGEVISSCGTHLGHNLPDGEGDRHCINLLCIAGEPAS